MSYPSDALRFANKVLRKLDCQTQDTLAKGRRCQPVVCPIANTIAAGIEATHPKESLAAEQESYDVQTMHMGLTIWVTKWDGSEAVDRVEFRVPVPKGASGFMERFDEGKYPQYDSAVRA